MAQGRTFLPIVFTTLGGIGPPEAIHYLDALFSDSYASELAATGSTRHTAHVRRLFYQSLLATLTKAIADMVSALTNAAYDASAADTSSSAAASSTAGLAPLDVTGAQSHMLMYSSLSSRSTRGGGPRAMFVHSSLFPREICHK